MFCSPKILHLNTPKNTKHYFTIFFFSKDTTIKKKEAENFLDEKEKLEAAFNSYKAN